MKWLLTGNKRSPAPLTVTRTQVAPAVREMERRNNKFPFHRMQRRSIDATAGGDPTASMDAPFCYVYASLKIAPSIYRTSRFVCDPLKWVSRAFKLPLDIVANSNGPFHSL